MTDIKIENVSESPLIRSIQLTTKDARGETDLGHSIIGIDTSKFALKDHEHNIDDINQLGSSLAGKANAEHGHDMSDITGLMDRLGKLSANGHRHDVSTLDKLNEIKQIDSFTTFTPTISSTEMDDSYTISVTPNTGNLLIMANEVSAAEYLKSTGTWNLKIHNTVSQSDMEQLESKLMNEVDESANLTKEYANDKLNELRTELLNQIGSSGDTSNSYTDTALTELKNELEELIATNLASSKTYTNEEVSELHTYVDTTKTNLKNELSNLIASSNSTTLNSAKLYTDSKVSEQMSDEVVMGFINDKADLTNTNQTIIASNLKANNEQRLANLENTVLELAEQMLELAQRIKGIYVEETS